MNKMMSAVWVILLTHIMIIQTADKEPLVSEIKPSRSCFSLLLPTKYTSIKPSKRVVNVSNSEFISFAAKVPEQRMGLQEAILGDNERLICLFGAPKDDIAAHLNEEFLGEIRQLKGEDEANFSTKLAAVLGKLMNEFYDTNPNAEPCNTGDQKSGILFLHLKNQTFCPYQLYCDETGEFKLVHEHDYIPIPEDQNVHFFVPLKTRSSLWSFDSPIIELILQNRIARHAMVKRQDCAQQVLKYDDNGANLGYVHFQGGKWSDSLILHCKTDAYKSLQKEWHELFPVGGNELERDILKHRGDNASDLRIFREEFRKRYRPGTSLEEQAPFIFLDDMIEQKQKEEASSIIARAQNLLKSLCKGCGSR